MFRLGLVKGSYIPCKIVRILREYTRYRYKLVSCRSSEKNRYQNALTVCNIALDSVVSDIFGKSSTSIIDYLLEQCVTIDSEVRIMRAKEELPECPVATAVSLIGGKWKLLILRNLKERPWRFNELQRSIDGISQKVLTDSLRQMMSDGLAYRHDYHEQPPRVEYGLTELGTKMLPIVNSLADFGNYYKSIIEQN